MNSHVSTCRPDQRGSIYTAHRHLQCFSGCWWREAEHFRGRYVRVVASVVRAPLFPIFRPRRTSTFPSVACFQPHRECRLNPAGTGHVSFEIRPHLGTNAMISSLPTWVEIAHVLARRAGIYCCSCKTDLGVLVLGLYLGQARGTKELHMTARHQKSPGVWLAADPADLRSLARQHRHFQASQFTKLHFARAIMRNSIPSKPSHHNIATGP
jgi:hypothetical protein